MPVKWNALLILLSLLASLGGGALYLAYCHDAMTAFLLSLPVLGIGVGALGLVTGGFGLAALQQQAATHGARQSLASLIALLTLAGYAGLAILLYAHANGVGD